MTKKLTLDNEICRGYSNKEAEEKADKVVSKNLREIKRTSWNTKDGMFNVDVEFIVKEEVVK